jgi:hypothetical protein
VFLDFCGSAGAQENFPVCRIWREGFSLSGGRIEEDLTQRSQRRKARKGRREWEEESLSHNILLSHYNAELSKYIV